MELCLDQIAFMNRLMHPGQLAERIMTWVEREVRQSRLPQKSGRLLEAILFRGGELHRGETAEILDVGSRQARRIVSALMEKEVLVSESSRAPLFLNFPAHLAGEWMPGLFPEK